MSGGGGKGMLETDGVVPKLNGEVCEALICQQYWHAGKLVQAVDALFIRVRERWHRLYFDEGIVFWRMDESGPVTRAVQDGDPFVYPLLDLGHRYGLNDCLISECVMEPYPEGARVAIGFTQLGTLVIVHSENSTSLQFVESDWAIRAQD
jgi:hypothetical protein